MHQPDWEKELERLHPASFRWALACCSGDREEAREVLQTVYLNLLDGRARFAGNSSPRTWLFSVIRRTALGRRRGGLVRRVLFARWTRRRPDPPAVPDPHAGLEAAERRARLQQALASMSERQRQVLELVYYHDLTIEQAARVMRIGLGSARTHYERGKHALLRRLTEEGL
jgi:RNA polymerase sigma-70 factor (ECF subfamily)